MLLLNDNNFIMMTALTIYTIFFSFHLPRRNSFIMRAVLTLSSLSVFIIGSTLLGFFGEENAGLCMYVICILSIIGVGICYNAKRILCIFWGIVGMATYGWISSVNQVILHYKIVSESAENLLKIVLTIVGGVIVYFKLVKGPQRRKLDEGIKGNVFFFMVAILLLMFAMMGNADPSAVDEGSFLVFRSLLSLLGLVLLYVFAIEYDLYDNYYKLKYLLEKDQIRYEVSKEYTDLINMKCHDLKHQLRKIKGETQIDSEYVEELEHAIRIYDSDIKTGNEALDIILTEKNQICVNENIDATFMVNGKIVAFIKPADLYSLFGNIMDNAIEAVRKLSDEDMRQISLVVDEEAGIVHIRQQNYFNGEVRCTDDKLMLTTKDDEENHGFGLKSIQYVTEKYGGVLNTEIREQIFTMNILIPYSKKM